MMRNYLKLQFYSLPRNQAFARDAVAAFCLELNPSLSALSDVKTAAVLRGFFFRRGGTSERRVKR